MTTDLTKHAEIAGIFPLRRPMTLAACAEFGARRYRRERDLPGAVPGLLAGEADAILPRLIAEEHRTEQARRERSAAYRPALHVQILSALLAEAAACLAEEGTRKPADTPPIPLRPGMMQTPARRPVRTAGGPISAPVSASVCVPLCAPQAKASGSEALRLAT